QRLIDSEARGIAEKAEAAAKALGGEIGASIDDEGIGAGDEDHQQHDLVERAADLGIVVEGDPRRRAQPRRGLPHRLGGASWLPPWATGRLTPRLMPGREPVPTLRSNTSA